MYALQKIIILNKKNIWNVVPFQICGQITDFYFGIISIWAKIWKKHFSNEMNFGS